MSTIAELRAEHEPDTRYHPADRCTFCDAERKSEAMSLVPIKTTGALGLRCDDMSACVRRKQAAA